MTNDDLRWLYRSDPDPEDTAVLPAEEGYPDVPPSSPRPPAGDADGGRRPSTTPSGPRRPGPPPSAPTATRKRRRRGRHRVRRTVVTLLLAWVLFLVATPLFAYSRIEVVEGWASDLPSQPGTAVLLVGSDGRGNLSDEDRRRLGTGSTEGQRTDTVMLLYTAPNGRSALVGLPRDSYVDIPGKGKNKLNAAYAWGGAPLLIRTVEQNTGVRIDGYLEVGMLGLVDMVDAVGGVEVCPTRDYSDRDAHLDIKAGCQEVDGVTALAYARMRKSDPRGDLGRMERQREVIGQIVRRTMHPMTFVNPVRYWQLNMAAAGSLARTDGTGPGTLAAAGVGLVTGWTGKGVSLTVPVADANARTKAGSSVLWDEAAAAQVFEAITTGDVDALEAFQ